MRTRILLAAAALCLGGAAPEATVTIDNFAFTPASLSVKVGTTVVWTNRDDIPHTIIGPEAHSPPLDSGDAYSFRFLQAGTFQYFCSLHPHMRGEVLVDP